MSELTEQQELEYVEAAWERIATGAKALHLSDYCSPIVIYGQEFGNWHAAYLFTLERQRQIAEIEEELQLFRSEPCWVVQTMPLTRKVLGRTMARLQHELEQLKRGMTAGG